MNYFQKIENKKEWQELLNRVLFKTFFHQLDWEDFLEKEFQWLKFERYIYQDLALLSLAKVKQKLISHPFCEYGGPLPLAEKIDFQKFQKDLFLEFKEPIKISFHPKLLNYFQNGPRTVLGSSGRVTYLLEGASILRKTTRHEIEKTQKQNLRIEKCQKEKDLKDLYNLFVKSAKKHRVPVYPFSFLHYFWRSSDSEIILAKFQNRVIAGSVFLFYDKFIHYFQNAVDDKYKSLGANYLILWNQIQNKGNLIFDLGGTRAGSSLEIFKSGWGGEKYPICELTNFPENKLRESKFRTIFGLLPCFLIKKLSPYLLKYKL